LCIDKRLAKKKPRATKISHPKENAYSRDSNARAQRAAFDAAIEIMPSVLLSNVKKLNCAFVGDYWVQVCVFFYFLLSVCNRTVTRIKNLKGARGPGNMPGGSTIPVWSRRDLEGAPENQKKRKKRYTHPVTSKTQTQTPIFLFRSFLFSLFFFSRFDPRSTVVKRKAFPL
jgi:hypothetical protein